MRPPLFTAPILIAILAVCPTAIPAAEKPHGEPNILFISIDDQNDWIGHLGGHPLVKTPHIDALATGKIYHTGTRAGGDRPEFAVTARYGGVGSSPPKKLVGRTPMGIRYADGSEELHDILADPREWHILADKPEHAAIIADHKIALPEKDRQPARGSATRILTYDPATDIAVRDGTPITRKDPIPE